MISAYMDYDSLSERDKRILKRLSEFNPLTIPDEVLNDINTCPFVLTCEGTKDSEAETRCFSRGYESCEIYQLCSKENREPHYIPQGLQDTAVMHADELVQITPLGDASVQEALDDGVPLERFFSYSPLRDYESRQQAKRWR
jgi:hypothetical protein